MKSKRGNIFVVILGLFAVAGIGMGAFMLWQVKQTPKTPLTWEDCIKIPNAKTLLTYPGQCVAPDGRKVTQTLTEEESKKLVPPNETISPDPVKTNWKTYTNTTYGYSISYPSDWKIPNESDDSYVTIAPNIVITASKTPYKDLSSFNEAKNPSTGVKNKVNYVLEKEITIDGTTAEITNGGCCGFFGKHVFIIRNGNIYDIVNVFNTAENFDQLLSTFKFLGALSQNISPICKINNPTYGFKVAGYYKCDGFNELIPNIVPPAGMAAHIVDDNGKELRECGSIPGPGGNTCPAKYYSTDGCTKITCPGF